MRELVPRVGRCAISRRGADINLTIDAEESERLELSLDVFEALARSASPSHPQLARLRPRGAGLPDARAGAGRRTWSRSPARTGCGSWCRLVKGAYWDAEIKRAQELGLPDYPVFTHKHHTDIELSRLRAGAARAPDVIFPQFATHNAGTIAAILQMARARGAPFELQRLHGMGESVYREVACAGTSPNVPSPRLRAGRRVSRPARVSGAPPARERRELVFRAPAGRRSVGVDELLASPLRLPGAACAAAAAGDIYGAAAANSAGLEPRR